MEIQIPIADQDTATEGQSTNRTTNLHTDRSASLHTTSDTWSRQGQVSTLTSRSNAPSGTSQSLHMLSEHNSQDENMNESFSDIENSVNDNRGLIVQATEDEHNTDLNKNNSASEDKVNTMPGWNAEKEEEISGLSQEGDDNGETLTLTETTVEEKPQEEQMDITSPSEELAGSKTSDTDQQLIADDDHAKPLPDPPDQDGFSTSSDTNSKKSDVNSTAEDGEQDIETPRNNDEKNDDEDTDVKNAAPTESKQDKVFLTENNDAEDDGSDISDVRAETPDWAEEDDEKDAGSVSGKGQKPGGERRSLSGSSLRDDVTGGHRAGVNTPVSYFTATDVNAEIPRNMESRNTSHTGVETAREAAYQRAMTLMTDRCDSKQGAGGEPLLAFNGTTYGYQCPQYFYVQQSRPSTMAPLKVWKGYHGNVYFEPMTISKVANGVKRGVGETRNPPPSAIVSRKSSSSRQRSLTATTRSQVVVPVGSRIDQESTRTGDSRSPTRSATRLALKSGPTSVKSATSRKSIGAVSQQHVLYLDRQAVARPDNTAMQEELRVIEHQTSTGSLNVQQRSLFPHDIQRGPRSNAKSRSEKRSGASSAKSDRICRGSVVLQMRRAKSGGLQGNSMGRQKSPQDRESPAAEKVDPSGSMMIVGDRFSASTIMSPLLRTQTQFSLSSQRMTVNSPDLYGAFERLPPLEQVRMSLRHMDAHADSGYSNRVASPYSTGNSVGGGDDMKPFIKYSPDVRAQYNRQIKYY